MQPLRVLQKHQNMLSLPSLCHEMGFMRTVFKSIVKSEVILAVLFNTHSQPHANVFTAN